MTAVMATLARWTAIAESSIHDIRAQILQAPSQCIGRPGYQRQAPDTGAPTQVKTGALSPLLGFYGWVMVPGTESNDK